MNYYIWFKESFVVVLIVTNRKEGGADMIDIVSGKTTKQLVDEFFDDRGNSNITKSYKSKIYRNEVWNFEYEAQKPLTEMNADEIITLIKTFTNNSGKRPNSDGYNAICYIFREFFAWYINKYKADITNPMIDRRLNGRNEILRTFKVEMLTLEKFEQNIADLRSLSCDEESTDYVEMIYRCALEGFNGTDKIISITEDMIDFSSQVINFRDDRLVIKISNRLMNLMIKCHGYSEFSYANKKKQQLLRFRGSYIGIPTNNVGDNVKEEAKKLNRYLYNNGIKDMSFTDCYRLGLIEYLKREIGIGDLRLFVELRTYENGYKEIKNEIQYHMARYGVKFSDTWLKEILKSYVK